MNCTASDALLNRRSHGLAYIRTSLSAPEQLTYTGQQSEGIMGLHQKATCADTAANE